MISISYSLGKPAGRYLNSPKMDLQEPMEEDEFQDQDILDQLGLASPQAQDYDPVPDFAGDGSKGAEILIMSVDLGDGRTGQITVHENDDPEYLAREFCVKFRLSEELVRPLTEQIEENVAELGVETAPLPQSRPWEDQLSRLIQKPAEAKPTINERSRDMQRDMRGVFERLQSKPLPAKPVPVSEITSAPPSKRYLGFSNPGEKLYFKGVKMKEDVRKHCQEMLKAKGSEESKELTFTPKLNDNSVQLTKRSRSALKHRSPEELLLVRGRISQENKEKTRGEQLAQEHSQCTFAPAINPVSERIVSSVRRSSSVQRFQELHEDAHKRKERQGLIADSFLAANCPFQPQLVAKQYAVEELPLYERARDVHKDAERYSEL